MVQLTGLVLCLHGAAKITHRAQRIVNIVSQWHALATVYPGAVTHRSDKALLEDKEKVGKQQPPTFPGTLYAPAHPLLYHDSSEDMDHDTDSESDDSPRFSSDIEQSIHDLESIQKRQALGTAFPNLLDFIGQHFIISGLVVNRFILNMKLGDGTSSHNRHSTKSRDSLPCLPCESNHRTK
jgi:hypothetical protein